MGMKISPPSDKEYAPFYAGYLNNIEGEDAYLLLRNQRDNLLSILNKINDETANSSYAENKWTFKQLLGHLIDSERIMAYRALAISRGEKQPLPGFEQDDYVAEGNFNSRNWDEMIEDYKAARNSTIHFFDSLTDEQFSKVGTANDFAVSVRALLYIIVGHERHHINILKEKYLKG